MFWNSPGLRRICHDLPLPLSIDKFLIDTSNFRVLRKLFHVRQRTAVGLKITHVRRVKPFSFVRSQVFERGFDSPSHMWSDGANYSLAWLWEFSLPAARLSSCEGLWKSQFIFCVIVKISLWEITRVSRENPCLLIECCGVSFSRPFSRSLPTVKLKKSYSIWWS